MTLIVETLRCVQLYFYGWSGRASKFQFWRSHTKENIGYSTKKKPKKSSKKLISRCRTAPKPEIYFLIELNFIVPVSASEELCHISVKMKKTPCFGFDSMKYYFVFRNVIYYPFVSGKSNYYQWNSIFQPHIICTLCRFASFI